MTILLVACAGTLVPAEHASAAAPVSTISTVAPLLANDIAVDEEDGSFYALNLVQVERVDRFGTVSRLLTSENCPSNFPVREPNFGTYCGLEAVAVDSSGNRIVVATVDAVIYSVAPGGEVSVIAGQRNLNGFSGDGGQATAARLFSDRERGSDLVIGADGLIYFVDNSRIRMIDSSGLISTVAGTGSDGYSGDGGLAVEADISPTAIAIDVDGSLLIAGRGRVRRVDDSGRIATVAGNGVDEYSGDGGLAADAQINDIRDLAVDRLGNIFIASAGELSGSGSESHRVRMIDRSDVISTIVNSSGVRGYAGDGGPAMDALIGNVSSLAVSRLSGDLYFGDSYPPSGAFGVRRVSRRGALSGTLRLDGVGAGGVVVSILEEWPSWTVVRTTTTDSAGHYSVNDLPEGDYRVRYFDPMGRTHRQWLNGATSYKGSAQVAVTVGGEVFVDQELGNSAVGALSGFVRENGGGPLSGAYVLVFDSSGYVAGVRTGPNGGYILGNLRPGPYWVWFVDPVPSQHWSSWYPGVALFPNATTLSVSSGVTVVDGSLTPV